LALWQVTRVSEKPIAESQERTGNTSQSDAVHSVTPKCWGAPRLLAPFASTKAETGTGLGLCRKTIDLHGGNLPVENEPGTGTFFTVTLPLEVPQSKAPPSAAPHSKDE